MNKHLGTSMANQAALFSFPNTTYPTRVEFAHDGSGDFVIVQSRTDGNGCDIVVLDRQDTINLAHAILSHVGEVAA